VRTDHCRLDENAPWKAQFEEGAVDAFGPGGGSGTAQPAVNVKALHAKIGELTLENDFLVDEGTSPRSCKFLSCFVRCIDML
jgi:hypothetical protein